VKPTDVRPIRVVEMDGKLYSLDNRRLVAFKNAGVDGVPIHRVSLDDPKVAREFRAKFNPIEGGTKIVITPGSGRREAEKLLAEKGKIK
jgi:hypothetical protein